MLRFAKLALTACFLVACAVSAPARDLKIAIDPDGSGFSVAGWAKQVAGTGTVFYQCQQDSCGRGSTVSLRKQSPGGYTPEALRLNEQRVASILTSQFPGKVTRVDISPVKNRDDKTFRISEVSRTIVVQPGVEIGMPLYWRSGFVWTTASAYTISSSAESRKLADSNFATFQVPLLLLVNLQSK
ncbi:hypothetical protein OIU35_22315 [Boseaceae bacterium BT-24-1]|nr:hypothetical protein [Boseaceae bacterium BT-24-1]